MGERQEVRFWVGKLKIIQGELEHGALVLLATRTLDGAFVALDEAARSFYGSEEDPKRDDERYESHGGAVIVSPMSVRGIGAEVFWGMRADTMARLGEGVTQEEVSATKVPRGIESMRLLESVERLLGCVQEQEGGEVVRLGASGPALLMACREGARLARENVG